MTDQASNWIVNRGDGAGLSKEDGNHVMAWARDSKTGEPVYILELDKTRAGGKCGCECPSCNLPLQAVNAAKVEYRKRPHFRHPEGAQKSECMYLSARLAAVQLLRESGVIQLPRRTMRGLIVGLSGTEHEAWAERPAQTVSIRDFNFRDHAAAILTLDDGRRLQVLLVGTGPKAQSMALLGDHLPTIWLDLPDASLASMSPEEVRSRLTLVPDSICWVRHWDDENLSAEALASARQIADDFLDLADAYSEELAGVEIKCRRETLLHLEVKRILAESREIRVPALRVRLDEFLDDGFGVEQEWNRPDETIVLRDVQLERKIGRVIPDVVARVPEDRGGMMMIEVTVTNRIGDERLARIRARDIPALEIDLSVTGGLVSRAELKSLVVYSLEAKRWLHHPELVLQTCRIRAGVRSAILKRKRELATEAEHRKRVLATPLAEIAGDYVDWVFRYAELDNEDTPTLAQTEEMKACLWHINARAEDLAIHGCVGAGTPELFKGRQSIIPRILSIKIGRGVGYKLDTTMAVMNAIRQSKGANCSNHSIYLIAEKVYRSGSQVVPDWYREWASEVRANIKAGDMNFIRDGRHDQLLSAVFPEMAADLKAGFGTLRWRNQKWTATKNPIAHSAVTLKSSKPLDFNDEDGWLVGPELEDWKRRYPDAARAYMISLKSKK